MHSKYNTSVQTSRRCVTQLAKIVIQLTADVFTFFFNMLDLAHQQPKGPIQTRF